METTSGDEWDGLDLTAETNIEQTNEHICTFGKGR